LNKNRIVTRFWLKLKRGGKLTDKIPIKNMEIRLKVDFQGNKICQFSLAAMKVDWHDGTDGGEPIESFHGNGWVSFAQITWLFIAHKVERDIGSINKDSIQELMRKLGRRGKSGNRALRSLFGSANEGDGRCWLVDVFLYPASSPAFTLKLNPAIIPPSLVQVFVNEVKATIAQLTQILDEIDPQGNLKSSVVPRESPTSQVSASRPNEMITLLQPDAFGSGVENGTEAVTQFSEFSKEAGAKPSPLAAFDYKFPDVQNDSAVAGIVKVCEALLASNRMLDSMHEARERCIIKCVEDALDISFTFAGYSEKRIGEILTKKEAYQRGLEFTNDYSEFRSLLYRIQRVNPEFLRYAFVGDVRIGASAIFAITDDAYDATIRKEREMFSYTDIDIVPFSNNLVLLFLAEDVDPQDIGLSDDARKQRMIAWFILHHAILIDPTRKDVPIRTISYEIISANTQRLQGMGFTPVHSYLGPSGREISVVVFDPTKKNNSTLALGVIQTLVREMRAHSDEFFKRRAASSFD